MLPSAIRGGGLAALIAACLAFAGAVQADTVVLRNGDRLSGTISHLSADRLTLQTSWGGELKIDRNQVASFETEGEVEWLPQWGGQPKRASFAQVASAAGMVVIDEGKGPRQLALSKVAAIKPRPEETADGVSRKGRITMSTAWAEGNSENERFWGEGDFSARAHSWRSDVRLALRRESVRDTTTVDNWLAKGNFDFVVSEDYFRYLRGSVERDRFKDIRLRGALGGGLGLQLLDAERTQMSVRGGVDLVTEERVIEEDQAYPAAGWGVTFKHRTSLVEAELFHDHEGFWNLEDTNRMTLRSRSGVRMPIREGLTASLQLNLDWEREPSPGRRSTDSNWMVGLGYEW